MTADRRVEKSKRIKNEVSMLFNKKPKVEKKRVVWHHKFVCLAHRDQDHIPTTDAEKEELYQAGLWEKEIELNHSTYLRVNFEKSCSNLFPV